MIIDILTKENNNFFLKKKKYTIVSIPILFRGEIIREKNDNIDRFTINSNTTLVDGDYLPEVIMELIKDSNCLQKNIEKKIISRISDKISGKFHVEIIINIDFVGINVIKNKKEISFINSSGNIYSGKVKDDNYIVSGDMKFPLSNILTIE